VVQTDGAAGAAILEPAKDSARTTRKSEYLLAVLNGYSNLMRRQSPPLQGSGKTIPGVRTGILAQTFNLRALGRSEEADGLAAERLKRIPAIPLRCAFWSITHDPRRLWQGACSCAEHYRRRERRAQDLNRIDGTRFYWQVELVISRRPQRPQLGNNNSSILHTLGCVYADVGKTKEAVKC